MFLLDLLPVTGLQAQPVLLKCRKPCGLWEGSTVGFEKGALRAFGKWYGPRWGALNARLMGGLVNTEPLSLRKAVAQLEATLGWRWGAGGIRGQGGAEPISLGARYREPEARG